MGCDGVLPRILGGLGRFNTPVNAILLCAVVALLALGMTVTTSTSFINFGAFLAFTLVNASVISHCYLRRRQRDLKSTILYLLFPAFGAVATFWLLLSLDKTAIILGGIWLCLGAVRLYRYRRARHAFVPAMNFGRDAE